MRIALSLIIFCSSLLILLKEKGKKYMILHIPLIHLQISKASK